MAAVLTFIVNLFELIVYLFFLSTDFLISLTSIGPGCFCFDVTSFPTGSLKSTYII